MIGFFKKKKSGDVQTAYNALVKLSKPGITRQQIIDLSMIVLSAGDTLESFTRYTPLKCGKVSAWFEDNQVKINIQN